MSGFVPSSPADSAPDIHRVLVVEDDAKLAAILVRALEHGGYDCSTAQSGDQVLWATTRTLPDAIVLDVMIPHPSGVEVCRHLRSGGWTGAVVMISARSNPEDRAAAGRAGANLFLAKPFPLGDLVRAVDSLLGRAPAG